MSRSENMSRIRGTDTGPELALRRAVHGRGLRFRVGLRYEFGRPDFSFPRQKVAVFVDGCFWHGCPEHYLPPKSRADFWAEKLRQNVDRDRRQTQKAREQGWQVLRIWEHEIERDPVEAADRVQAALEGRESSRPHVQIRSIRLSEDGDVEREIVETR